MQFDRNGVLVRTSQPVKELRTVKKTLLIDSRDRDPTKYVKVNGGASSSDAGDFVVYLPRVYENVVSLRLKSAIIAAPSGTDGFLSNNYVLMSIEGLDKIDETATGAQRSGLVDNQFARIPNPNITSGETNKGSTIFYNDKSFEENIVNYTPPIGRLDRMHIQLRYHPNTVVPTAGTNNPATSPNYAPITFGTSNHSFTFEIEYLENGFDQFSSFETQMRRY
jgi:hypothetical protein